MSYSGSQSLINQVRYSKEPITEVVSVVVPVESQSLINQVRYSKVF